MGDVGDMEEVGEVDEEDEVDGVCEGNPAINGSSLPRPIGLKTLPVFSSFRNYLCDFFQGNTLKYLIDY